MNDFKALFWNVRGMGDWKKRRKINRLIHQANPTVIFLSETKMENVPNKIVRLIGGNRDLAKLEIPSQGASGGMLMCWDINQIELLEPLLGAYTLTVRCRFLKHDFEGIITGVYGPNHSRERKEFFKELYAIHGLWNLPWLLGGILISSDFQKKGLEDVKTAEA